MLRPKKTHIKPGPRWSFPGRSTETNSFLKLWSYQPKSNPYPKVNSVFWMRQVIPVHGFLELNSRSTVGIVLGKIEQNYQQKITPICICTNICSYFLTGPLQPTMGVHGTYGHFTVRVFSAV